MGWEVGRSERRAVFSIPSSKSSLISCVCAMVSSLLSELWEVSDSCKPLPTSPRLPMIQHHVLSSAFGCDGHSWVNECCILLWNLLQPDQMRREYCQSSTLFCRLSQVVSANLCRVAILCCWPQDLTANHYISRAEIECNHKTDLKYPQCSMGSHSAKVFKYAFKVGAVFPPNSTNPSLKPLLVNTAL